MSEMAVQFAVSEMTVRRVLDKPADAGLVIRTPDGAKLASSGSMERAFLIVRREWLAPRIPLGARRQR